MFGTNKIFKLVREHPGTYEVQEVFKTIQGEGPFTGIPAIFIRMGHCSLACNFCDTDFSSPKTYSDIQLAAEVVELAGDVVKLVVITGGEPMRQQLAPLIGLLTENTELSVQIETAGIHWEPALADFIETEVLCIVCSPKTSHVDPELALYCREFKYIVSAGEEANDEDGLPLMAVSQAGNKPTAKLYRPPKELDAAIYVQPMDERGPNSGFTFLSNTANIQRCVELCLKYGYRMSLQTHKILNVP